MTDQRSSTATVELLPCPFCGPGQSMVDPWFDDVSKRWAVGCGRCGASSGRSIHAEGSKEAAIKSWNTRGLAQQTLDCGDDENRMDKISALISRLQMTFDQFGDTCVYIRRGGLSWGAVALNRRADDQKHGVFDLQAQHDRDMEQRAGQVERLIADRNRWMERAMAAEKASAFPSTKCGGDHAG